FLRATPRSVRSAAWASSEDFADGSFTAALVIIFLPVRVTRIRNNRNIRNNRSDVDDARPPDRAAIALSREVTVDEDEPRTPKFRRRLGAMLPSSTRPHSR